MRKGFRLMMGLVACSVLLISVVQLAAYLRESRKSCKLNAELAGEAVVVKTTSDRRKEPEHAQQFEAAPTEIVPIEVDFNVLLEINEDVIGWIYCEDTPINYPLVQGADNDYYLRRVIDGTRNTSGTLFADCRNAGDFSDVNTILYGHNMKDKSMFGTLAYYKEQSYYEEHPIFWILTPDADYRVDLIAGFLTDADSAVYSIGQTEQEFFALLEQALERSTFQSDYEIAQGEHFLTLSTCSYEHDNARYVLIGRLIRLE